MNTYYKKVIPFISLSLIAAMFLYSFKVEAAVTATNLTNALSTSGLSSYTTASISPGTNKLDIVTVVNKFTGTGNVPTVTGAGGTWVQIATVADAASSRRVTMFRDMSASPGTGALTIDFAGQTQDGECAWSVDEFSNTDTSGTHGSGAIVQSASNVTTGTQTGLTVTLAALSGPNNVAYGGIRSSLTNIIVKGGSFTELSNNLSDFGEETEWATNQTAVNWTWTSGSGTFVGLAIEIKASTVAVNSAPTVDIEGASVNIGGSVSIQ